MASLPVIFCHVYVKKEKETTHSIISSHCSLSRIIEKLAKILSETNADVDISECPQYFVESLR